MFTCIPPTSWQGHGFSKRKPGPEREGLSSFTKLKRGNMQVMGSAWQSWPLSATSGRFPVPLSSGFSGLVLKDGTNKPEMPLQEKEKKESSSGTEQSPAEYTLLSILL